MAVGRYGDAPWGQIGRPNDESYGPQATGIPGVVRVIYVPEKQPIVVRNLDAARRVCRHVFRSGERHEDRAGARSSPTPPVCGTVRRPPATTMIGC